MTARRLPSIYIPPTHIMPIECEECGENARAIWHSPLPAGLKGEMRVFECEDCGSQMKLIVDG
jgi:hypothetical protein